MGDEGRCNPAARGQLNGLSPSPSCNGRLPPPRGGRNVCGGRPVPAGTVTRTGKAARVDRGARFTAEACADGRIPPTRRGRAEGRRALYAAGRRPTASDSSETMTTRTCGTTPTTMTVTTTTAGQQPTTDNDRTAPSVGWDAEGDGTFPGKLLKILNEEDPAVVSWLPSGLGFVVHRPDEFARCVLPRHFRHGNMTRFRRQLDWYGFRRIDEGPDVGAYRHELFRRDQPDLCLTLGSGRQQVNGGAGGGGDGAVPVPAATTRRTAETLSSHDDHATTSNERSVVRMSPISPKSQDDHALSSVVDELYHEMFGDPDMDRLGEVTVGTFLRSLEDRLRSRFGCGGNGGRVSDDEDGGGEGRPPPTPAPLLSEWERCLVKERLRRLVEGTATAASGGGEGDHGDVDVCGGEDGDDPPPPEHPPPPAKLGKSKRRTTDGGETTTEAERTVGGKEGGHDANRATRGEAAVRGRGATAHSTEAEASTTTMTTAERIRVGRGETRRTRTDADAERRWRLRVIEGESKYERNLRLVRERKRELKRLQEERKERARARARKAKKDRKRKEEDEGLRNHRRCPGNSAGVPITPPGEARGFGGGGDDENDVVEDPHAHDVLLLRDGNGTLCLLPHDYKVLKDRSHRNKYFRSIVNHVGASRRDDIHGMEDDDAERSSSDDAAVGKVIAAVHGLNPPGRFLERTKRRCWIRVGEAEARDLTSRALLLACKSSNLPIGTPATSVEAITDSRAVAPTPAPHDRDDDSEGDDDSGSGSDGDSGSDSNSNSDGQWDQRWQSDQKRTRDDDDDDDVGRRLQAASLSHVLDAFDDENGESCAGGEAAERDVVTFRVDPSVPLGITASDMAEEQIQVPSSEVCGGATSATNATTKVRLPRWFVSRVVPNSQGEVLGFRVGHVIRRIGSSGELTTADSINEAMARAKREALMAGSSGASASSFFEVVVSSDRFSGALGEEGVGNGDDDQPRPAAHDKAQEGASSSGVGASTEDGSAEYVQISTTKSVGARVYARYSDGDYYWGQIEHISCKKIPGKQGKKRRFSVVFEDGDTLSGIHEKNIFTEEEYVKFLGELPRPQMSLPDNGRKRQKNSGEGRPGNGGEVTSKASSRVASTRTPVKASAGAGSSLSLTLFDTPLTLTELHKYRCKECTNCKADDCGRCYSCCRNISCKNRSGKEVCLHKMCCQIEDYRKAQPADLGGFSAGWTFVFNGRNEKNVDSGNPAKDAMDLLRVFTPNNKRRAYRLESVMKWKMFDEKLKEKFLQHVGIDFGNDASCEDDAALMASPTESNTASDGSSISSGSSVEPFTLAELHRQRCKECVLCKMKDCGHCYSCRRNVSGENGNDKQVCLRKMCCSIEEHRKVQPADLGGFPPGWSFIFYAPKNRSFRCVDGSHAGFNGLRIFSPDGRKFSLDSVVWCTGIDENVMRRFLKHVGIVLVQEQDESRILVGKGYRHEWTDAYGTTKVIYGQIVSCSEDWEDGAKKEYYNVRYSDESISLLGGFAANGLEVPKTRVLPCDVAWGGGISFDRAEQRCGNRKTIALDHLTPCKCWVAPDMRKEELVADTISGLQLPRLTLVFRGCKLVFSVKKSTIPNAGYGLFVKWTSLKNHGNGKGELTMEVGELLDIGVYAPFRAEDKKHECVVTLKNYIHSSACEEWCFNAADDVDHIYDITDEVTGELHGMAKQHVPAYVNECDSGEIPTIYAEDDPEGSVHYLFGVAYDGNWERYSQGMTDLRRKLLEGEFEVFVNYGMAYEEVRRRKGYSTSMIDPERLSPIETNDKSDGFELVEVIDSYDVNEISMCLEYFQKAFISNLRTRPARKKLKKEVVDRVREVLERIQNRLSELAEESSHDEEKIFGFLGSSGSSGRRLHEMVKLCKRTLEEYENILKSSSKPKIKRVT